MFSQRIGPDVDLPAELRTKFAAMARDDRSGLVRLVLASTLQRLPINRRAELARALFSHPEDAADHNLPALVWTGLIAVADAQPQSLAALASECRVPEVVGLFARRLGEDIDTHPEPLDALLVACAGRPPEIRSQVISGLVAALAGYRKAGKPAAWDAFQARLSARIRGLGAPGPRAERALRRRTCPGGSQAARV